MSKKETSKTAKAFEYDLDVLLENCEAITGHKREVGAGALFGSKVDKMTKAEFEKKVKDFLKKEVK